MYAPFVTRHTSHLTCWAEYGRNWTIASMCAMWRMVHTSNICVINLLSHSFISTSIYNSVHHTCEYNELQNRSNHFDTPCICQLLTYSHVNSMHKYIRKLCVELNEWIDCCLNILMSFSSLFERGAVFIWCSDRLCLIVLAHTDS